MVSLAFGVDCGSSAHIDDRTKDILILGKGLTWGLEYIILTAEPEYSINFSEQEKKFCLNLHYNRSNSYIFVNGVKIYQFKAKRF